MEINYRKILEEHRLLPVENWDNFEVTHYGTTNQLEEKRQLDILRARVGRQTKGVYVYKKDGDYLYVGKGASLYSRFQNKYQLAYQPHGGDRRGIHHAFFALYTGPLTIYWKEVELETDRKILELVLDAFLKPLFTHPNNDLHL